MKCTRPLRCPAREFQFFTVASESIAFKGRQNPTVLVLFALHGEAAFFRWQPRSLLARQHFAKILLETSWHDTAKIFLPAVAE